MEVHIHNAPALLHVCIIFKTILTLFVDIYAKKIPIGKAFNVYVDICREPVFAYAFRIHMYLTGYSFNGICWTQSHFISAVLKVY
jgi:hypothetical protein